MEKEEHKLFIFLVYFLLYKTGFKGMVFHSQKGWREQANDMTRRK